MFQRASGISYLRFFRRLHAAHVFDWYLEIGCRDGRILNMVQGKAIGVDPVFRLAEPILGRKPALHLFQETSDAFFAADRLHMLGAKPSVTFIDGMHLFEYALRDFIGAEAHADPNGVIYVHDCFPFNHAMTTRDLDNLPNAWAGDVWKLKSFFDFDHAEYPIAFFD
ncbi:MAG: class I SAM-dependent methyltransferase, partial [Pseudomonadota bacterium]